MKANLKNILIIITLVIFMWAWNSNADFPAAARTAPTSTNSHSLSAELANSSADDPKIMDGDVLIATNDFNLRPENIKKDVEIYGMTGTYDGGLICKSGKLTPQKRWCDNEDGTVTDMTTGLIWLKNAGWGGLRPYWADDISTENAYDRVSSLHDGAKGAGLSDGSKEGDWRLPTQSELKVIAEGKEAVYYNNIDILPFTGLKVNAPYTAKSFWSSSIGFDEYEKIYKVWAFGMDSKAPGNDFSWVGQVAKTSNIVEVWPVRNKR